MTLYEMLDMLTAESPKIFLIAFVLMSLIQVAPIKINPWDKLLTAIGSLFNRNLSSRIDKMEDNLNSQIQEIRENYTATSADFTNRMTIFEQKLDQHIKESDERDLRLRRESILDFASAVANGRNYTKEQYDQILKECDSYEMFCEKKNFRNSVAMASIAIIQKTYEEHIMNNDFLASRFGNYATIEEKLDGNKHEAV